MKIGELAAQTGIAASAIRFYEQSGLLPEPQRGSNGYRSYSDSSVQRLRFIQIAQTLGFPLDVLRSVFASTEGMPKDELMRTLDDRAREIDAMMATLRAQRRDLRELRAALDATWDAGECLDPQAVAQGMATQPARPPKARRRAAG